MRRLCLVAAAGAVAVLGGCGGDGSQAAPPGSPENPLVAHPQAGETDGRLNEAAAPGAAREPGYQALVEGQERKPEQRFSPCSLVTAGQAAAIVGAPIEDPLEAPQGPTCIYRSRSGDSFVTIAVQAVDFQELRRSMQTRRRVSVAGGVAYCGAHGQPVLYAPVAGGRVLSIAAPCPIARQFAARAVRRLTS